ncbi:MAG: deoxynucleoside kinase [Clostridiales bacterium]|jgi:dTMP kinase|nr:deoxynucleoside kinase [Eubacteriales bacterium]MDH7566110.1 deoxynucleoside kinase [Clostridiales bacterium]
MTLKGKLIVIEGVDSSGKATHTARLCQRLSEEGYRVRKVEFPDYKSPSSALVKMYLNGEFGSTPEEVNPYAASTFYAVDRFASYKTSWEDFYLSGGIVIADRYTMSNMIHQASKVKDEKERAGFLDWLLDFEFVKLGLPVPDCVVFLDMPPEYGQKLMQDRKNKFTGESEKDIHEKSYKFLLNSYRYACGMADTYRWNRVPCVGDGAIKGIHEIHQEIYSIVKRVLTKDSPP